MCLLVPWHALIFTTLRKPDWKPLEKVAGSTMQDAKDKLVAYALAPQSFIEGILRKYIDSMPDDSDDELAAKSLTGDLSIIEDTIATVEKIHSKALKGQVAIYEMCGVCPECVLDCRLLQDIMLLNSKLFWDCSHSFSFDFGSPPVRCSNNTEEIIQASAGTNPAVLGIDPFLQGLGDIQYMYMRSTNESLQGDTCCLRSDKIGKASDSSSQSVVEFSTSEEHWGIPEIWISSTVNLHAGITSGDSGTSWAVWW
ncbi:hypothetical protein F5J12DRAFT_786788 [Pisolithus orientalis]|uniref:uncharacterized protein n=1 Tax=Pisolithus orientalis TaxID=936130 RepID=UPI0022240EE1|nr:uncharacterized protein F5J12DRAFT_786788 [Pisolithus orientalis]KAI5988851.1 hypothetical protein F5J12DRAFT_786788 [Pisolithus orientalis]